MPHRVSSGYALPVGRPAFAAAPAPAIRPVRFGDDARDIQKRIEAEFKRLKESESVPAFSTLLMGLIKAVMSFFGHPSQQISLASIRSTWQCLKQADVGFKARAGYNVTGNADYLNWQLPYRHLLTLKGDPIGLQRYERLVKKIQDNVQFYETTDMADFDHRMQKLTENDAYKAALADLQGETDPEKIQACIRRMIDQLATVQEADLKAEFDRMKPLSDPATRYYLAANIAELFLKKPELVDAVLNHEPHQGDRHPLRIVVGRNVPLYERGGLYRSMLRVISVNNQAFWLPPFGNTISQHEFVHAASENQGQISGFLPGMTEEQTQRFVEARRKLGEQYNQQDQPFPGRLYTWLTGKTSTGIPNYGFTNEQEFLTVTLDLFKQRPDALCQTEAGKALYNVYKEVLGLDPLQDFEALPRLMEERYKKAS